MENSGRAKEESETNIENVRTIILFTNSSSNVFVILGTSSNTL